MYQKKGYTDTSDEKVMEALRACGGVISDTAKMLKLRSAQSLRVRIKKSEVLNACLEECRADLADYALDNVQSSIIKDRDMNTTRWYLSLMNRDFMPKSKLELDGSVNITVKHDLSKLSIEELTTLESILGKTTSE